MIVTKAKETNNGIIATKSDNMSAQSEGTEIDLRGRGNIILESGSRKLD